MVDRQMGIIGGIRGESPEQSTDGHRPWADGGLRPAALHER